MKKIFSIVFIFNFFILGIQNVYCQLIDTTGQSQRKDSINKNNDSLNTIILKKFNAKQEEMEKLRIADSITKARLVAEIGSLQTTDNLKKQDLEKQLQEIRNKEALRFAEKKKQIDSLRLTAKGYPVLGFFNDTLFFIYNKSGSFSAEERADAIYRRIQKLSDNFRFAPDSIQVSSTESTTDLSFKDVILMSISDNDALWNNATRYDLAENYRQIIGNEVIRYKHETTFSTLAKEIGLALLVILIVIVFIKYINKSFRWATKKIRQQEGRFIKGIRIKNYTLLDAGKEVNAFLKVNTVIKWLLILLIIYIALPIVFGIFPWTKGYADTLFGYVLNPLRSIGHSFWNFLPNLITIIVIVIVFRYIIRFVSYLKDEIRNGQLKIPGFYADWANPSYQIVRILILAFMLVVIFPYLPGSNSRVFQGVTVFLGFLFTFGSAGSLSNIISGLILTYMRLFKIGDRVKIADVTGDVIEKSLLVTRIRTIKNEIISIPNSTVMSSHTINYSSEAPGLGLILNTTVTIGYDVPWKKMYEALIEAALRTEYVLHDPRPFVLQTGLEDFYVSYQINAYIREANKQTDIYSELYQNIQDVCNEKGIEIMSPHYRAARDGSSTTIPADYLPEDYKAPGFNINKNEDKKSEDK